MKQKKPHIILVWQDHHGQFVDETMINAVLDFMYELQPDEVVFNGDLVDFPSISPFNKLPVSGASIKKDFPMALRLLQRTRGCCKNAKLVYVRGNHERRLVHYLHMHPELKGVAELDIAKQLWFDKLKIKHIKYAYMPYKHHRFVITHGKAYGKRPAIQELNTFLCSGVSGHVHRYDRAVLDGHYESIEWHSGGGCAEKKMLDKQYSENLRGHQGFFVILRHRGEKPRVIYYKMDNDGFYSCITNKFYKRH